MRSILRALFPKDRRRTGRNAYPTDAEPTASCGLQTPPKTASAVARTRTDCSPLIKGESRGCLCSCRKRVYNPLGPPLLRGNSFSSLARGADVRPLLLAVVSSLVFSWSLVSAQDFAVITGKITDDVMFQAIAGVVVTVLPEGTTAISDSDGRYRIARIMPGTVSLQFASAFFVKTQSPAMLVREGELATVDVALHPVIVKAAAQTVSAERERDAGVQQYTAPQIRRSMRNDVGGFLIERGYQIQSDGRAQYLSLGGLSPQRTVVLLDGVRINPDGAAADLSTVSLSSIERIEVYTSGAAARFGDGALGGAVNIISRQTEPERNNEASLTSAVGSYSLTRESLQLTRNDLAGLQLLGNYEYGFSRNDYAYAHPYLGEQRRANNFSRLASYFVTLGYDHLRPLTLSARHYDSHHGLPGAVLQETPTASARHVNTQFTANFATSTLRFVGSYRELTQDYLDAQSLSRYDKHYLQVARQLDLEKQWSLWRRLDVALGSQYLSESFFNDDRLQPQSSSPSINRKTSAVFGRGKIRQNVWLLQSDYSVAYRLDHVDGCTYPSPHFALSFSFDKYVDADVTANYAESFRLPSIDALFWSNDVFAIGNPDLQSERARSRDVQLSVASRGSVIVTMQVRRFVNDVDGMIFWRQRFDGKYTPVNLARARVDGTETSLTVSTSNQRLSAQYHRTTQNPVNLSRAENYYGQVIPFQPDHSERVSLTFRLWRCKFDYTYSLTGARFIREANTKSLSAYHLHDLSLEYQATLFGMHEVFTLAVYNAGDVRYEILERVPMPGRSITISLTIQL
jgi:vitamin B12 transporter